MIYFDNAATTKVSQNCLDTFIKLNNELFANPSSPHYFAFETEKVITKANNMILKYLGLDPNIYEIIQTSGASESNNLAIKGFLSRNKNLSKTIITSKYEHPSVTNTLLSLQDDGYSIRFLDGQLDGTIFLDELDRYLLDQPAIVSIMLVNNETGNILDLSKVRNKINSLSKNTILMSDCTQAIGKIDFDYSKLDMITLSFHKINGLKGSGLLIKKKSIKLNCEIDGGGQQSNLRSGTLNAPLIAANAIALKEAILNKDIKVANANKIRNYIVENLNKIDEIEINTNLCLSSPFILNFSTLRVKASVVVEELSNKEIYVSTTSACSSHSTPYSKVLKNMGLSDIICENSIRLSFSGFEDLKQADIFLDEFNKILTNIRK